MSESKILKTMHNTAQGLYEGGLVDRKTMREFDAMCLPKVKELTPKQIAALRKKNNASQAVFAAYLNTSLSTVRQWEQGQKHPSHLAMKLLNLVDKHGIGLLAV